jgi:hypothetical protein
MDIDIDFGNRDSILAKIVHAAASLEDNSKHNTGVYVTTIPKDPLTNQSTINYKEAEKRGYFKIDFLNVSIYNQIESEQHLQELMAQEPKWKMLETRQFVDQLFHLSGYSNITRKLKPASIPQLAAVLAIIRPSKKYLLDEDWTTIMKEVWIKPSDNSYYFKKAHATSYAVAVVVQMNLLTNISKN